MSAQSGREPTGHTRGAKLPTKEPERWLLTDNRFAIEARIRGLETEVECIEWIRFEGRNRQRAWIIRALNDRIKEINAGGGENGGE